MPIHIDLIDDGHILLFRVTEPWTAADIPPAKEKSRRIYQQATHPVHALVDLQQAAVTLQLISASQQVIGGEPFPNSGQIALVGVPKMLQLMARPILSLMGGADTLKLFDTIEQAKAYLYRYISPVK